MKQLLDGVVAIQFAVYELAPALARAARDNDGEGFVAHDIYDFEKIADESGGDRGILRAVDRGKGKHVAGALASVAGLVGVLEEAVVLDGEGDARLDGLNLSACGFGQLVDGFLVVGVDVGGLDVHTILTFSPCCR